VHFDHIPPLRLSQLAKAITAKELLSFTALTTATVADLSTDSARLRVARAQAWGFWHYLLFAEQGRYRPLLGKALANMTREAADTRSPSDGGLLAALGPPTDFERAFRNHIRGLTSRLSSTRSWVDCGCQRR
jgi:hypothetical protein